MQGLPGTHDPQLFAFITDQPDFRGIDLFVEAMRLVQSDDKNS
jgi:hypothetical protein